MLVVIIHVPDSAPFKGTFKTQEEAEVWVENHHAMKIEGAEVEYVEEHLDNRAGKFKALRKQRDSILCATDWLFVADAKIDPKWRKMYMIYRQYLRDLPSKIGSRGNIAMESFEHWIKRNHPEEFMDGGKGQEIIKKFKYYIK